MNRATSVGDVHIRWNSVDCSVSGSRLHLRLLPGSQQKDSLQGEPSRREGLIVLGPQIPRAIASATKAVLSNTACVDCSS